MIKHRSALKLVYKRYERLDPCVYRGPGLKTRVDAPEKPRQILPVRGIKRSKTAPVLLKIEYDSLTFISQND